MKSKSLLVGALLATITILALAASVSYYDSITLVSGTGQFTGNGAGLSNAVAITAGTGITVTPSGNGRSFAIAASGGGGSALPVTVRTAIATNATSTFALNVDPNIDGNNGVGLEFDGAGGTFSFYPDQAGGWPLVAGTIVWESLSQMSYYNMAGLYDARLNSAGKLSVDVGSRTLNDSAGGINLKFNQAGKIEAPSGVVYHGNGGGLSNISGSGFAVPIILTNLAGGGSNTIIGIGYISYSGSLTGLNVTVQGALVGAGSNYFGFLSTEINAGVVTALDIPVTSAASGGTVEGYSFTVDGGEQLQIKAQSDGAGGVTNRQVVVTNGVQFSAYGNTNYPIYALGTAYSLTTTPALLDFGTTDPSITIGQTGTYLIYANVGIKYNGATYIAAQTATVKLRRTNNTAADLSNGSRAVELPVLTTFTGGDVFTLPPILYTATAGDIVQIFGSVSAAPSAGSVDADSAEIVVMRIY